MDNGQYNHREGYNGLLFWGYVILDEIKIARKKLSSLFGR